MEATLTMPRGSEAGPRAARRWELPEQAEPLRDPTLAELAHIPGRRGLPYFGVMPEVVLDPMRFASSMVAKHGPVYRFFALGRWHVHLAGAEANELLLFDERGIFSAEGGWSPLIGALFPGALLIKDGAEHRASRRLLGEAFRQAQLTGYQRIFAEDIEQTIGTWVGREIDTYREVKRLTFRVSASTFLGLPLDELATTAIGSFAKMMGGLLTVVKNPRLSWVRRRAFTGKARLEEILRDLIVAKRAEPGDDFLSRIALLRDEEGRELSIQEITDSFIFLLTASHDTLASGLTSVVYYLAAFPEWAKRLRDEIEQAGLGSALEAGNARLPLQDMFFKEVLRLNGPAPVLWRRAMRPFTVLGTDIPAGTMVGCNLLMTHRLPDVWEDPLRFDPLRFSPESEAARSRHVYAPFGGGVHKCLGLHFSNQQARIFITELLGRADLELAETRPVSWYHWPNCRPRRKLSVRVNPRYPGT